jgi:hypothetical protein
MPILESMAYPNAVDVLLDMLADIADTRTAVPPNYGATSELIVVRRLGGGPDEDDLTDNPIVQVACYAPTFPAATALAGAVQVRILSSPLTEVNGVLVDEARVVTGEQEVPDVYPDDRRIVSTYQLGWRRQFRPS